LFIENLPLKLNNTMRRAKKYSSTMATGLCNHVPLGRC